MTVSHFEVDRIDVTSSRPYSDALAIFEKKVPPADGAILIRLATTRANPREIEDAVRAMTGELELISFARLEQGPLVSLLGKPKKMINESFHEVRKQSVKVVATV